jgi:hypothetical protein
VTTAGLTDQGKSMLVESRRRQRWTTVGVAALALQFAGIPALAADSSPAPTAEELADEAFKKQEAGQYSEAIGTYVRAYQLSRAGAILFNIAILYDRKLHEHNLAMEYFRRYLQAPDAESSFIQKATERLSVLKREADEDERRRRSLPSAEPTPGSGAQAPVSPAPSSATLPASPPSDTEAPGGQAGWHTAGVVVGGVGLAGVGASMVLGLLTKNKASDANQFCSASACRDPQRVTLDQQAKTLGTAATGVFVAGAALLATGVTIYLLAPKSASSGVGSIAIGLQARPSLAALKLDVRF